jgi:hypothetical protein
LQGRYPPSGGKGGGNFKNSILYINFAAYFAKAIDLILISNQ